MIKKEVVGLILVLLVMPLVSSSHNLGNSSDGIRGAYGLGEKADGWLNMSFSNEFINLNLSTNFGSRSRVIDLLGDYTCNPPDCLTSYTASNPQDTKTFPLSNGDKRLVAITLSGNINSINSLSFSVTASSSPSCVNPLKVDILNDGSLDGSLKKVGSDYSCIVGTGKGCYQGTEVEEVYIGNVPYCENITLIDSAKFRLGTWVKKDITSGNPEDNLKMILFDGEDEVANCRLPTPTTTGGEIYCDINYSNNEIKSFFVCVSSESQDETKYFTKKDMDDSGSCGFNAFPGWETELHDYYVFARAAKFENIGTISYNQGSYEDLLSSVSDYVLTRYNNNCTTRCVIPILFSGYSAVSLTLFNLSFGYRSGAGNVNSKQFYDVNSENARFSSGFSLLDISKMNITLPNIIGDYDLKFYLDGENFYTKEISVGSVPSIVSINPLVVPAGGSTKITASISTAGRNITSYRWDFGDESGITTTSENYASHTYSEMGSYTLSLEIEDDTRYTTTRSFSVSVVNPKDSINTTIKKYKARLSNISLDSFGWYKNELEAVINISGIQQKITSLETRFYSTQNESKYIEIMNELSLLSVPIEIKESGSTLPFFPDIDSIDVNILSDAGAGDFKGESDYKEAVGKWMEANFDMSLDFRYVTGEFDFGSREIMSAFKLNLDPKTDSDKKIYLVIQNPGVNLAGGEQTDDYTSKIYNQAPSEIMFSGDLRVSDINLYFSPAFSLLEIDRPNDPCNYNKKCEAGETRANCPQDCRPWFKAWILWIILFIAAVIAYMLLQWWYKVRYETYLFKNRNDIYNILNFMSNAKSQGMSDSEISSNLKKSGWNGEQINYVFKKMRGKAIMPFDFLKFFRKKENRYKG